MKFFFDTEFIEDGKTIDLISIGIVSEDGREYYAISKEFDASKANDWVKENVLAHLPNVEEIYTQYDRGYGPRTRVVKYPAEYKTRAEIRDEVLAFIGQDKPEIWAYYADYDWVVLCQLFGRMLDLPKGWPYFCRDIKQVADSKGNPKLPDQTTTEHHALEDAKWVRDAYQFLQDYGRAI
jgi:hypothetical protein